ncbi:MAG: hypothetical protein AB1489_37720 [Acidobacteriota bacterium]
MRIKKQALAEKPALSLKIYCPVYQHYKNTIVCSLSCSLRDRCRDFQQFYQENRAAQDAVVSAYIERNRKLPADSLLVIQYSLEVVRKNMSDTYVWIGQDGKAQVMTYDELIQVAENGEKPKHIFLVKQELALRYQLVPKSRVEETKTRETNRPTPESSVTELPEMPDLPSADVADNGHKDSVDKPVKEDKVKAHTDNKPRRAYK